MHEDAAAGMSGECDLLDEVWAILAGHAKGQDTPQQTLVRLWKKHWRSRLDKPAPTLNEQALNPRREEWTTAQLGRLWRGHARTIVNPDFEHLPVVVVRCESADCLVDGTTRINKRIAGNALGRHPVIILEPGR